MPLEFFISQKDKTLLLLNGYLHNIHQKYYEKIVWHCTEYKKFSCKGRCHTTTDSESGIIILFLIKCIYICIIISGAKIYLLIYIYLIIICLS